MKEDTIRIDVQYRGGWYEARRRGEPGKVFDRRRGSAITKALSWRAFHPKQNKPKFSGHFQMPFIEVEVTYDAA